MSNKPQPGPIPESGCPLCNSPGRFSYRGRDLLYDKTEVHLYMQCGYCGAVYHDPMPGPAEISGFYPDDYMVYKDLDSQKRRGSQELAVLRYKYGYGHLEAPGGFMLLAPLLSVFMCRDAIRFVPDGKGLDVGCGNGKFIRAMNSLGWRFEGVEFNPVAVEACRKAEIKVFHGDLKQAAFPDNTFNLVSARHLVEHLPDPNNFVEEVTRILKKGGRFVVRTPNIRALARKWFGRWWYANDVPRHLVLFSPENLNMLAGRHGLRPVAIKTFTTPKIFLNSWDYLTRNRGKPSKKRKIMRLLARPYVMLAKLSGRGDELFAIYEKS